MHEAARKENPPKNLPGERFAASEHLPATIASRGDRALPSISWISLTAKLLT